MTAPSHFFALQWLYLYHNQSDSLKPKQPHARSSFAHAPLASSLNKLVLSSLRLIASLSLHLSLPESFYGSPLYHIPYSYLHSHLRECPGSQGVPQILARLLDALQTLEVYSTNAHQQDSPSRRWLLDIHVSRSMPGKVHPCQYSTNLSCRHLKRSSVPSSNIHKRMSPVTSIRNTRAMHGVLKGT